MESDGQDIEEAIVTLSSLLSTAYTADDSIILRYISLLNDSFVRRQGDGNSDNICRLVLLLHRFCDKFKPQMLAQVYASYVTLIKGHNIGVTLTNELVIAFLTFYYTSINDFMNDLEANKPLTDIAMRAMSVFNAKIAASIALISNKLTVENMIKCYEIMCYLRGVMHYYESEYDFIKENIDKFNDNFRKIMSSSTASKNNYMVYRDTCLSIIKSRMTTTASYIHATHAYKYNILVKLGMSIAAVSELQVISNNIASYENNIQYTAPLLIEVYLVALGDLFHGHSGYLYDQHFKKLIPQSCTITVTLLRALCTNSHSDYIHSMYLKYCVSSLNNSTAVIARLVYATCYAQLNDMYQMYIMNSIWNVFTAATRLDNNLRNTISISCIEGIVATIRDFFVVGSDEAAYALLMNLDSMLRAPTITAEISFDNCSVRHTNTADNTCYNLTAVEHLLSRMPYYSLRKRNSVFLQRVDALIDVSISSLQDRRTPSSQQSSPVIPQGFALNILYGILKDFDNSSQGAEPMPPKLRLEPMKQTLLTWLNNLCRVLPGSTNCNKMNIIKISGIIDCVEKLGFVLMKATALDPLVIAKLAGILSNTCPKLCSFPGELVDTKCVYGSHEYHLKASESLTKSIYANNTETITKLLETSCLLISALPPSSLANVAVFDLVLNTIKQLTQGIQSLPINAIWLMKSILNTTVSDMLQKCPTPSTKKTLQPYVQNLEGKVALDKCMKVSSTM